MGDPVGAARHVRQALAADGTWLIVEPVAGDTRRDEPQPGRPGLLRLLHVSVRARPPCRRTAGYALGAQAGEAAIREIVAAAGFTRFRRAAETPFNAVYDARP